MKVLYAGDSAIIAMLGLEGAEIYPVVDQVWDAGTHLQSALEGDGVEVVRMPSHVAYSDFPETAEALREYDAVVDGIGGPMLGPLLDATAPRGRVVVYGNSADAESTFRVERFYNKGVTILGFRVFASVPPTQGVKDMANLADQAASGALEVKVQATAPLAEALPLIRDLYDRKVTGKVVLTR